MIPTLVRFIGASLCLCVWSIQALEPFRIDIQDAENGWPVPLVELRTTHHVRFTSDNAGVIAFDLPELMGVETWFTIEGHGYTVPKDGFGYRGVKLTPQPGGKHVVKVHRMFPAKRLGRITGGGLFGESQKLGLEADWKEQGILGCDSVQNATHRGKQVWLWGDTTLARYPLGLFHMIGATTELTPLHRFEPPVRLRYDYVLDEARKLRVVGRMPGEGPTWISGLVSLPDANGIGRLVATYVKIEPPLSEYELGQCIWNDEKNVFEPHQVLWNRTADAPKMPRGTDGHVVFETDANGATWALFGDPFPRLRCAATVEAWSNPDAWEKLTPQPTVRARDGTSLTPHRGSIAWNDYRNKWVSIFTQLGGKPSHLGEIWFAEADKATGPWGPAIKVVTHENHTFYNPLMHPTFTPRGSAILLFEGTYTREFANHAQATPRHDYNQVLYRLDLDDPVFKWE
ncbi:MAG: hypothetical protein ACI9TH_000750 [Kiritimatiellia bacterium]|jgi:hypothetical protein